MNPAMAAQYHQQYQAQHHSRMSRGPHSGPSGRRGMPAMIPNPQQAVQQQQRGAPPSLREAQEQASERYKHDLIHASGPQERNLPDGLEDIVIGNGVEEFKRLRAIERKLDAIVIRKRLELRDQRQKGRSRTRKLRIWITNSAENQLWQGKDLDPNSFDFNPSVEPTYKVTIVGKIMDEDKQQTKTLQSQEAIGSVENENNAQPIPLSKPKLSDLFKSIAVRPDFSKGGQAETGSLMEWKKQPANQRGTTAVEFDSLQFERSGDKNINCTINLLRDEQPEKFAMAKPLQDLVCEEEATQDMIMNAFLQYVRKMGLQRDDDKRTIRLDETLRAIFGDYEYVQFPRIWELVTPHLRPVPPIELPYTIRVDPEFQANPEPTVYDIMVAEPDPVYEQIMAFMQDAKFAEDLKKIKQKDNDITAIFHAISVSKNRYSFFSSLAKDPVTFLRRWTSSQKRDLEIILSDSRTGSGTEWVSDEFRRGGPGSIWSSENAKEAVDLIVHRPNRWGK